MAVAYMTQMLGCILVAYCRNVGSALDIRETRIGVVAGLIVGSGAHISYVLLVFNLESGRFEHSLDVCSAHV